MSHAQRTLFAAVAAVLLGVTACTTVPDNSAPEVVKPVAVQPGNSAPTGPPPGAEPRSIVEGFLNENGEGDPTHANARLYLTREERASWSDATVTVLDHTQVGNLAKGKRLPSGARTGHITVTGQQIGTIDENGVYKPFLRGNGSGVGGGVVPFSQTYHLVQVGNEWRIGSLPPGLLVTASQFSEFRQYEVYFLDGAGDDLAPVARYTQLAAASDVIKWLVSEVAKQPPSQLNTGLPQNGTEQVTTTVPPNPSDPNSPVRIEIPGASALDHAHIARLAAQVAATLLQVSAVDRIQITDGGAPVRIPGLGPIFAVESMSSQFQPSAPGNNLYYVRGGGVYQESGRRIPGRVGAGGYRLDSVAVTISASSHALQIAGVRGSGTDAVLDIPSPRRPGALVATSVHGVLSRPAWAPGRMEVWIGNGAELERVTGAHSVQTVALDVPQGKASGQVSAVRISPDGGRVALVLTAADSSQIYIGTIVRNANQVSVTNLQPISPQAVTVTDVAWNDDLKLFAIGRDTVTGVSQVYEVQCDGSIWNPRGNTLLPGAPDSVTAAAGSEAVVSTDYTIWQQNGTTWQGLLDGETLGTNPVYLE